MTKCPKCETEIEKPFGLMNCSGCGVLLSFDFDGNLLETESQPLPDDQNLKAPIPDDKTVTRMTAPPGMDLDMPELSDPGRQTASVHKSELPPGMEVDLPDVVDSEAETELKTDIRELGAPAGFSENTVVPQSMKADTVVPESSLSAMGGPADFDMPDATEDVVGQVHFDESAAAPDLSQDFDQPDAPKLESVSEEVQEETLSQSASNPELDFDQPDSPESSFGEPEENLNQEFGQPGDIEEENYEEDVEDIDEVPELDMTPSEPDPFDHQDIDAESIPVTFQEEVKEKKDPSDLSDVSEFGNSEESTAREGDLFYDLIISGIDSTDMRDELREALRDSRFGWELSGMMASIKEGALKIKKVNAVKASVLIKRIKGQPFKISWVQSSIYES